MFLAMSCSGLFSDAISFGTDIRPSRQIRQSRKLAKDAILVNIDTIYTPGDHHFSYYFPEAAESFGFRVCTPKDWDGKRKLPLVMFLHGGWNDESSYLDRNNRQMVDLASRHGYILVSPLGGHAAYGNFLALPAGFGKSKEAGLILSKLSSERIEAQKISEKDVINVLEIVLRNYPVNRRMMFLTGHSMGGGGTWYLGAKYNRYWKAIAPMSGPFVLENGYPWESLRNTPIFVTEGSKAERSVNMSRKLRSYLEEGRFRVQYKEYEADHTGMVSLALPDVFEFFDRNRN